jgi:hypothetical protein
MSTTTFRGISDAHASEYLAYALGISDKRPTVTKFGAAGIDVDRMRSFWSRFLNNKGLKLQRNGGAPNAAAKPAPRRYALGALTSGQERFAEALAVGQPAKPDDDGPDDMAKCEGCGAVLDKNGECPDCGERTPVDSTDAAKTAALGHRYLNVPKNLRALAASLSTQISNSKRKA